jgi:hypothetical protein
VTLKSFEFSSRFLIVFGYKANGAGRGNDVEDSEVSVVNVVCYISWKGDDVLELITKTSRRKEMQIVEVEVGLREKRDRKREKSWL